jgi:tetratricopeptide (TPR) repeat protein
MGQFTARLLRVIRPWDRPSQIALASALALLVVTGLVAAFGPADWRHPALIGAGGLFIITQITIMWGNRGMTMPYTRAQQAYLAEDFQTAVEILEMRNAAGKADFRELTLLGNTYRQLGQLDKSEEVLTQALVLRPNHHFPLYGFGRTLLVEGRYAAAIVAFERALAAGAPLVVQFDLGDACFRLEAWEDARRVLEGVSSLVEAEPHRALMTGYLLYRLDRGEPPSVALVEAGLPYWRAQAERFRHTSYGQALANDVRHMQTLGGGRAHV